MLDVVSDVFLGECANTLSTESQPLRHAVEEMYVWNTTRVLIGYLSMPPFQAKRKRTKMVAQRHRKFGALLPGNIKASAVVDSYLEHVIEHAMTVSEKPDSKEKRRKEQTLLGSLLAQGLSRKAGILILTVKARHAQLIFVSQRIKDQIMAVLLGGKVRLIDSVLAKMLIPSARILAPLLWAGRSMNSPALRK